MPAEEASVILAIISDQELTRELKKLLQGSSFDLQTVPTARAGFQMAEDLLPDAILVDIDLDGNGLETCRRLRANRLLRGLPILMLCRPDDHDARALGLSAGADDFISKPFDAIELLSRMRSVVRLNAKRLMITDLTRFNWMASHAEDGYVLLDNSGAIHFANETAQVLLNLPEDYLGLPFVAAVDRRFTAHPQETWSTWIDKPDPLFLVQPETVTARAAWVSLDGLDTMIGVERHRIAHLKDVTERMSIYQDMRRFHTVVAHKLRTPMSLLVSSTALLKSRLDQLSPEEIKDLVRSFIKGVDRLANHVQQILTYIDAPLALNVSELAMLDEIPKMVRAICGPLRMRNVVVFLPPKLQSTFIALTQDALEIILYELLLNARKFHPDKNPTVEVAIEPIDEKFVRMRVADNGQTLSVEQLSWAWVPYVQGEKDFTGELPGMGLGIPMVATLLWKAGGDIHLRNRHDGPGVIIDMKVPLDCSLRAFERPSAP
jgi:DNA-binding response OmpR family regulator/nitrogen-specific signal transduction histidine kinase